MTRTKLQPRLRLRKGKIIEVDEQIFLWRKHRKDKSSFIMAREEIRRKRKEAKRVSKADGLRNAMTKLFK